MKQLQISRKIQSEFLESIEKRDLQNWYNQKQPLLDFIANHLQKVEVPKSHREKEQICEFICNSFLVLFSIHWQHESSYLLPETIVGQFFLRLKASYESNQWHQFYKDYENYFDSLIYWARAQEFVDIRIEDKKGNWCSNFHEAKTSNDKCLENDYKLAENGKDLIDQNTVEQAEHNNNDKRTSWFCCSKDESPHKKNQYKSDDQIVTRQPVLQKPNLSGSYLEQSPSDHPSLKEMVTESGCVNETSSKLDEFVNVNGFAKETSHYGGNSENVGLRNTTFQKDIQKYAEELDTIVSSSKTQKEDNIKVKVDKTQMYYERPEIHRTPSQRSNTSAEWENRMNSSFQRKLNKQNEQFGEKLRKIREERERLNREAEEDMRQFRKESVLRIQMFLRCIQLRIRWEEQEQEWGDWLKSVRAPVVKVRTMFFEFDDSRGKNDEEENSSEVMHLHRIVQNAYDKLTYEFGNLTMLSDQYEDKLFLRVLQKRVSQVATKLCILMEELDEFKNNDLFFSKMQNLQSQIDPMEIPTASELRRICKNASSDEYNFITPPKLPKSYCVINEI